MNTENELDFKESRARAIKIYDTWLKLLATNMGIIQKCNEGLKSNTDPTYKERTKEIKFEALENLPEIFVNFIQAQNLLKEACEEILLPGYRKKNWESHAGYKHYTKVEDMAKDLGVAKSTWKGKPKEQIRFRYVFKCSDRTGYMIHSTSLTMLKRDRRPWKSISKKPIPNKV